MSIPSAGLLPALKSRVSDRKGCFYEAVYFESIDALRAVLTDKRLELLKAIKENRPNSIYELAKIVGRDIKNVNEDVRLLADLGFVKLEKRKTDRKRTVPTVDYSSIMLEIAL